MSVALSAAQAAFHFSTSALTQLGGPVNEQPEKSHSLWAHWPVVTAGTTCLITTINAVALAVLGNIPLGTLLFIAAVGAGILTVYLWSFSTLKDLEEYVEVFAERVTALAQTALHLSVANKDLDTTRLALETQVQERNALFEKEKLEVSRVMQQLDHVTADLQQSSSQVEQMKKILDGSHSVITEMTTKIGDFVHLNVDVSSSSQLLNEQLASIQALGSRLGSTVQKLDEENKELLEKKNQADEMAHELYTQFVRIAELLVQFKKEREQLEVDLRSLQKTVTSLGTHTSDLKIVATDLEQGASDTQAVLDTLRPYNGLSEYIKQRMENVSKTTDTTS